MPKKKINKKNAVTFQLVYRSQQDPLIADEDAPQRVLIPVDSDTKKETEHGLEKQYMYDIYDIDCGHLGHGKDVPSNNMMEEPENVDNRLSERIKKDMLRLPISVFPSKVEEEIGMLAKAAPFSGPQLHLDPDVVAAMDDDFDYCDPDNQLEDNFIALADDLVYDQKCNYDVGTDSHSDNNGGIDETSSWEESRFTTYSMTSSVIKRNDQLTLLDKRFEKIYADYTNPEIGALDSEEIEADIPDSTYTLLRYADQLGSAQITQNIDKSKIIDKIKESCGANLEEELVAIPIDVKDVWDCESMLSTYSTSYNHPKLISESKKKHIEVDRRSGIPKQVLHSNKLSTRHICNLNREKDDTGVVEEKTAELPTIIPDISTLSIRNKHEAPEERKIRKRLLKEYRKERRLEKKLNTEAFKEEKKLQTKITINNRNSVLGNNIV